MFLDVDLASVRRKLAQTTSLNLTRAEWSRYFPASPYRRTTRSFPWPHDLREDDRNRA